MHFLRIPQGNFPFIKAILEEVLAHANQQAPSAMQYRLEHALMGEMRENYYESGSGVGGVDGLADIDVENLEFDIETMADTDAFRIPRHIDTHGVLTEKAETTENDTQQFGDIRGIEGDLVEKEINVSLYDGEC
ncbi:hypothetical protein L6452_15261 [Arctium lappa]|uniref:Uncharacterized protein n=1 Tax=Arctium lappa TaxID=4217 RepID=A0ACB9CN39_ARCLA|nr:hypothetical protein L6452_15261 [Arctium lappa]